MSADYDDYRNAWPPKRMSFSDFAASAERGRLRDALLRDPEPNAASLRMCNAWVKCWQKGWHVPR